MTVVDLKGEEVRAFLSRVLANDVARLQQPGKALYGCLLNENGHVIDDLITYYMDEQWFRLVVNAATREKDLEWLHRQAEGRSVEITEQEGLAMLAVQGPSARDRAHGVLPVNLRERAGALQPFNAVAGDGCFIARTGYTGEDGYEILVPAARVVPLWNDLLAAGVRPCGLGARDTLRLEAGMNLYGQDMDETVTPLESALGWTVAMKDDRAFIGREALERQQASGVPRKLVGLVLEGRGVLRPGQAVITEAGPGETTSGGFSPTLQKAIALARVPAESVGDCEVEIRGKALPARMVRPPFVRNGEACAGIVQ
jgi:aminomethyltransferase